MSRTARDHSRAKRWYFGIKEDALGRDKKPGSKPAGWWKRMRRRLRRAKQKWALLTGRELPVEKKNDVWDWN